jgi:hypothetical protein
MAGDKAGKICGATKASPLNPTGKTTISINLKF